jgi:cytidyltransferase-like protein
VNTVYVYGSFDNLQAAEVRLLEEASKVGHVVVLLWNDTAIARLTGRPPVLPLEERQYWLEAIRYVSDVRIVKGHLNPEELPPGKACAGDAWIVRGNDHSPPRAGFAAAMGIRYEVIPEETLLSLPEDSNLYMTSNPTRTTVHDSPSSNHQLPPNLSRRSPERMRGEAGSSTVLVTGCYDWFHSGHVRFFEEVSELGDLYVVIGHDQNVTALKGEGHPMFPEFQRWYMVQSIRYVKQAIISSGGGWLDAEPEIRQIKPDIYAVNEDGDKPIKRRFCEENGIDYVVFKREPKEGLKKRSSTDLRGF